MNWITRAVSLFGKKSPVPFQGSSWLVSALNGTHDRSTNVDLMVTATLYRAVSRIANDLAAVPLVIEERTSNGEWRAVEPAPRGQKSPKYGDVAGVFERANPSEGKGALWIRFHSSMELDGRAVLFTDYVNNGQPPKGKPPKELRFLRPDKITPIWPGVRSEFSDPISYRYNGVTGSQNLRPDEVLWHVYPDPRERDRLSGLAPAAAASLYARMEDELGEYTADYFRNGARGSLNFSTDQSPGEEQRRQMEQSIEKAHVGRGKRFKIFLTTHGLKANELNGRRDTDFADLFGIIKEQISMVYGVPPAFLSDYGDSGVRANLEEQTPIYVEGTLMPKGALLEQNLTELVLPRFDPNGGLRARLDWDALPIVQRMVTDRTRAFAIMVGGPVISPNDARAMMKLPPMIGGDVLYPAPGQVSSVGPVQPQAPVKALKSRHFKWIDDPARHAKRIASGVSLDRFEKPAEKMIRAYFSQAEARTLHNLEHGKSYAKSKAPGDLFDEEIEVAAAEGLIARIYGSIANTRGPEAAAEAGGEASDFLIDSPAVRAFLVDNAYKSGVLITGTTADKLKAAIVQAHDEGTTTLELANIIRDVFAVRRDQATTIARTEVVRAYNFTTFEGYKQTGIVDAVAWLTAHDDKVRDSHMNIDGDVVPIGTKFSNGCQFPGDPDGLPEETINCIVDPLTPIHTRSGPMPVAVIGVGDEVLTHRGRYRRVVRVRSEDRYSGDLVTLWTRHGQVSVTAGHPLYTASGWNRADSLQLGDPVQILCPSANVEGADFLNHGIAHLPDRFLCGCVPNHPLVNRGEEGDQLCASGLDPDVRQEQVGAEATGPGACLESMHRHPVGAGVLGLGLVDASEAERVLHPMKDGEIAVSEKASRNPSAAGAGANGEATICVEEPCDVGEVLLRGSHKPMITSWATIVKIERTIGARGVRVYNFAVDEDESYIAADFISHNCRCVLEAAVEDVTLPKRFSVAPGTFAKLFPEKALTPAQFGTDKATR